MRRGWDGMDEVSFGLGGSWDERRVKRRILKSAATIISMCIQSHTLQVANGTPQSNIPQSLYYCLPKK